MPRKITVHAEQILDAAFELVRRDGLSALSARAVAREIGCSTQPVYRAWTSMETLRSAVIARAEKVALDYLMGSSDDPRRFLQVGLGNLRFARDEPELYMAVTRHGRILRDLQQGNPPPPEVLEQMKADPVLAQLSDEQLTRVHALMWFFGQGVAHIFFSEYEGDPMERAQDYLELAGRAVVELELRAR
jgi:AcrR family transcriptional regulator